MISTRSLLVAGLAACSLVGGVTATAAASGPSAERAVPATDVDIIPLYIEYQYSGPATADAGALGYSLVIRSRYDATAHLVIQRGGDVEHDIQVELSTMVQVAFNEAVYGGAEIPDARVAGGCEGGSTERLRVVSGTHVRHDVIADSCSPEFAAATAGIDEIVGPVFAELDLDGLLGGQPSGPDTTPSAAGTELRYSFTDSSVPPQYHRSYVLTVADDGTARVVVDSYGTVLHDVAITLPPGIVAEALAAAEGPEIADVTADPGCTGGVAHDLTVSVGEERVQDVSLAICGSNDVDGAEERVQAVVEPILVEFDMDALLAPGDPDDIAAGTSSSSSTTVEPMPCGFRGSPGRAPQCDLPPPASDD